MEEKEDRKSFSNIGAEHKLNIQPGRDFGGSQIKPSNPKDSVGIRKAPMSTIPAPVLFEIGLAMLEGARKYGRHNYRAVGVRASVYYDALMRHVAAWWEGEDVDPDSGLPHLSKATACLVVLRDSQRRGNCTDDRPPKVEDGWVQGLNALAIKIIEKYPDPKEAFVAAETQPVVKFKRYAAFAPLEKPHPLPPIKRMTSSGPELCDPMPLSYRNESLFPIIKTPGYETRGPCEFEPTPEDEKKRVYEGISGGTEMKVCNACHMKCEEVLKLWIKGKESIGKHSNYGYYDGLVDGVREAIDILQHETGIYWRRISEDD